MPEKLNHIGLAAHQNKVYLSGGFFNARQTRFSKVLYVYDVQKKEWSELVKMPSERGAHIMIIRNNHLHLIGGRNHKTIWSFDINNKEWKTDMIAPLPEKRDHISVLQGENKLYSVGKSKSVWKSNPLKSRTTNIPTTSPVWIHQIIRQSKAYDKKPIIDIRISSGGTGKWSSLSNIKKIIYLIRNISG